MPSSKVPQPVCVFFVCFCCFIVDIFVKTKVHPRRPDTEFRVRHRSGAWLQHKLYRLSIVALAPNQGAGSRPHMRLQLGPMLTGRRCSQMLLDQAALKLSPSYLSDCLQIQAAPDLPVEILTVQTNPVQ